ncbi:MAG: M28 family peptidase [Treponema sp.]|jgi:hypothetical protein|nr:M28 family peptidase [Treponema sp.]
MPYDRFDSFIAPGADRFLLLRDLLAKLGLHFSVIPLAGNRHFFIGPESAASLPGQGKNRPALRGRTVLAAHYDRAAASPGANDNSAAVFMLIETALKLREAENRNWLVIFTDKEELGRDEGIRDQGSYSLAAGLKKLGLRELFIFDACGAGDTLIISTAADHLMKDEAGPGIARARRQVRNLRNRALETARNLLMEKVLLLPTPFSDDAGLLRAGLPAQTITVLPAKEAAAFAALLRKDPGIAAALLSREARDSRGPRLIPETWRSLNGPGDSPLRLTPQHYRGVVRFALALCGD